MPLTDQQTSFLRESYGHCRDHPLEPEDALYVPIYQGGHCEDPVARMRTHIEWNEIESLQFFSGFRGSGKTTELFRLRRDLKQSGAIVLYADALEYVNPTEPIDVGQFLMFLAGAFSDAVSELQGRNILRESYWNRLTRFLTRTTVSANEVGIKAGEAIDIKLQLKTEPTFRQRVSSCLAGRLGELKKDCDEFIGDAVKAIKEGARELPVVFIFDQMERMQGSLFNEEEVIRSVERLFTHHDSLLRLPLVHSVYTVPPWLKFVHPGGVKIEVLPCLRMWRNDPARTPEPVGIGSLRELIRLRLTPVGFRDVFGERPDDLVDRLVVASGGQIRDLLSLLREMLVSIHTQSASLPVSRAIIDECISRLREQFLPIALSDARWMARVDRMRNAAIETTNAEDVSRLSRFLDTHHVLYFSNGEEWYDLHPVIRDEVARLALAKSEVSA
jgi:hypothetical protein